MSDTPSATVGIPNAFINADMELRSKEDLSPIAKELANQIFILHNAFVEDEYFLAFECSLSEQAPAPVIHKFLQLLDSLSQTSTTLLDGCTSKVIDVGYESKEKGIFHDPLPSKLLRPLSAYGFDINITIYPASPTELGQR